MMVSIEITPGDIHIGDECPRCGGRIAAGDRVTPLSDCLVHVRCSYLSRMSPPAASLAAGVAFFEVKFEPSDLTPSD